MTHPPTPTPRLFAALDGAVIPGGCDHCDAEQHIDLIDARVTLLTIHHDHWCPRLRAHQARR